jgi:hypothetical protein
MGYIVTRWPSTSPRGSRLAFRLLSLALSIALLAQAQAAGVKALFNLDDPVTSPFPSNVFTVPDRTQNTGLRVNLPKPDCTVRISDCADIDVLNTLDGFNLQPRISIPFSGAIDVNSVNSRTVFLVRLGSTLPGGPAPGNLIGINQVVWDPATLTLHAESDELLDQHTRYLVIVTNGVRDTRGDPVETGDFGRFRHDLNFGLTGNLATRVYRQALADALDFVGIGNNRVVAASVVTTQSATAVMEKIRDQIRASSSAPADFRIGSGGERAVFPLNTIAAIISRRQTGTGPTFADPTPLQLAVLFPVPGAPSPVEQIAFGKYSSPDYETLAKSIPATGTLTGTPAVQGRNDIYFDLFLPAGSKPAGGWPVAIVGHGFGGDKDQAGAVAAVMASRGIATIAINAVGHGGGPLGTLTVSRVSGNPVTFLAGGRGIDQNGDGAIDPSEGIDAAPIIIGGRAVPNMIGSRDGLRQTVIDLMQLVRIIEAGVDVDGDGSVDLDRERIYYLGGSLGGIYGSPFVALEPRIRAGALNVPGGSIAEVERLGSFRNLIALSLATRIPPLLNDPISSGSFIENIPLRNQPPVVNIVPGAMDIQKVLDNTEWVSQAGNPVAYAPHLRKTPLAGMSAKRVIIQFARGDQTVPNPTTTAILRAGDLADRATYFRYDRAFPLLFAADPTAPKNPHRFLIGLGISPAALTIAIAAQSQIADFFASDGVVVSDPDGPGLLFETPIVPPLPEELNFIP